MIAILTAKDFEYNAILSLLEPNGDIEMDQWGNTIGGIRGSGKNSFHKVVLSLSYGELETGNNARDIINHYPDVDLLVFVGCSAGVEADDPEKPKPGNTKLGDVVISRSVVDISEIKLTDENLFKQGETFVRFTPRGVPIRLSRNLLKTVEPIILYLNSKQGKEKWKQYIYQLVEESETWYKELEKRTPEIKIGNIGSSNMNVNDKTIRDYWFSKYDIICFEMEGIAVATIAELNDKDFILIRGISDMAAGDRSRDEFWQPYASRVAAAFLGVLLEKMEPRRVRHPIRQAPLPPVSFTGRKKQLEEIKKELLSEDMSPICLWGIPGIGKTTIAKKLAHDAKIEEKFVDGTLWANVGQHYKIEYVLRLWSDTLSIPTENLDAHQISEKIRLNIGDRSMLLVVDDIWHEDDSTYFIDACGCNCKLLFTTRSPAIAQSIADVIVYGLGDFDEQDGIDLLKQIAPSAVEAEPTGALELVREVRALPLALFIWGKYLAIKSLGKDKEIIRKAIRELKEIEAHMNLNIGAASLSASIAFSYRGLDLNAQNTLRAISHFRPNPNDFSEDAALAVSGEKQEQLQALKNAGLLEQDDKIYTMHAIIAAYGRSISSKEEAGEYHRRATEFYFKCLREFEEIHNYDRQYLYEKPEWQRIAIEWLYHLAQQNKKIANLNFADLYFGGFWWWGVYWESPFCNKLLEMGGTQESNVDEEWLANLMQFHKNYPHHHSYPDGYNELDTPKWQLVKSALESIRKLGGLKQEKSELDQLSRHVRALTNMFLADSAHYIDKNYDQALDLVTEAKKLFEETDTDDDNWNIPWTLWYLGDLYLERKGPGDFENALKSCRESIEIAEEAYKTEPDKRDNEVISNCYRVLADVFWKQDKYKLAFQNYAYAAYFAYLFQRYPHEPDSYTINFYEEMRDRTQSRLNDLWHKNKDSVADLYNYLLNFWKPYWDLLEKPSPEFQSLDMSGENFQKLVDFLLPPIPAMEDMGKQETEYVNRVEKVSEKIPIHVDSEVE